MTQKRSITPSFSFFPPPITNRKTASYDTPSPTPNTPFSDLNLEQPTSIIIRAANGQNKAGRLAGKKTKLSTIVDSGDIEGFYSRYAEVCRGAMMGSMRKRDRSKAKAKEKAKKVREKMKTDGVEVKK